MREDRQEAGSGTSSGNQAGQSLLVEDVLLLLFQPSSGAIVGENTLFYLLGGAVAAELVLRELAQVTDDSTHRITARGRAPAEEILRPAWDYAVKKPRDALSLISVIGPVLRSQTLDRLVEHGHLRRTRKRILGILPSESLKLGSPRREELLSRVRAVLVDGKPADARTTAIAALLSASGNLHQLDPDIPWTSSVIHRAKEFENGTWGATTAGMAVTLSTIAIIIGALASARTARGE